MKKHFLPTLFAILLFASCRNAASDSKSSDTNTVSNSANSSSPSSSASSSNLQSAADDAQKRVDELKKLQPISNESLKSFFPDEVMGTKRSSFDVTNSMGYAIGNAEYRKDDTTNYKVTIYDCAGEAGSAFYGMTYLTRLNMEREDDNGYQKTVDFMNTKSMESYSKGNNMYSENFVADDRFWVALEGQNTGLDNLKSFAQALNLDRLKSLK